MIPISALKVLEAIDTLLSAWYHFNLIGILLDRCLNCIQPIIKKEH